MEVKVEGMKQWTGDLCTGLEVLSTVAQLEDFRDSKVYKDIVESSLHGIEMCRLLLEDPKGSWEDDSFLKGQIGQLKQNVNLLDRLIAHRVQQDEVSLEEPQDGSQE
jgi:hypothetical protein